MLLRQVTLLLLKKKIICPHQKKYANGLQANISPGYNGAQKSSVVLVSFCTNVN
jgi:hypothetical protein